MSLKLTTILFSLSFISSCQAPNPYTSPYRASCECDSLGYVLGMGPDEQSAVNKAQIKCNAIGGSSATNCTTTKQ